MNSPAPKIEMSLTLNLNAIDQIIRAWVKDNHPAYHVESIQHSAYLDTDWRGDSCGTKYSGATIKLQPQPAGR